MEIGTYEGLKNALEAIPNDDTVLLVNAYPFVDFNFDEGGYLEYNDETYKDAFITYADCNYMQVAEIEDVPHMGWGIVYCEAYQFAVPFDAQIEYGYESL